MMPKALVRHTPPEVVAARLRLRDLRAKLAAREVKLNDVRAQLRAFESEYMLRVGTLYAALDEWAARIAEREVDLYDSADARQRAAEARQRAAETHKAAYDADTPIEAVEPTASLKGLFREVAKRIHPDFARDTEEEEHFTRLMSRANIAYTRGDAHVLQRLLDDHREIYQTVEMQGVAAQVAHIDRQAAHAERDLAALDAEREALLAGDIACMREDAEAASRVGRDLLAELAAGLRDKVADAQRRFIFTERQIDAQRGSQRGGAASDDEPPR